MNQALMYCKDRCCDHLISFFILLKQPLLLTFSTKLLLYMKYHMVCNVCIPCGPTYSFYSYEPSSSQTLAQLLAFSYLTSVFLNECDHRYLPTCQTTTHAPLVMVTRESRVSEESCTFNFIGQIVMYRLLLPLIALARVGVPQEGM